MTPSEQPKFARYKTMTKSLQEIRSAKFPSHGYQKARADRVIGFIGKIETTARLCSEDNSDFIQSVREEFPRKTHKTGDISTDHELEKYAVSLVKEYERQSGGIRTKCDFCLNGHCEQRRHELPVEQVWRNKHEAENTKSATS